MGGEGAVIAAAGRGTGRHVYSDVKAEMLINVHCSCHIHGINKYQIKSRGRDSFTKREMKVPLSRGVAQTAYRRDCKHKDPARRESRPCAHMQKAPGAAVPGIPSADSVQLWWHRQNSEALPAPLKSAGVISGHDIRQSALGEAFML